MDLTTALGLVAGSLTTIAYFPQVLKTWRSRSADGMSWSMLVILCMGIALWLVYGLYAHDVPVILANVFTLLFSSAILAMKIRYEMMPSWMRATQAVAVNPTPSLSAATLPQWELESEVTFTPPEPESEPTLPVA